LIQLESVGIELNYVENEFHNRKFTMIRIITIDEEEVLLDYRAASNIINDACVRDGLGVVGCSKHNNFIVVNCESASSGSEMRYLIAPIDAKSDAELIASIRNRYDSGFSTISTFEVGGKFWALFAQDL